MPPLNLIDTRQTAREMLTTLETARAGLKEMPRFIRMLATSPASLKAYIEMDLALAQGKLTVREREQIALAIAEIDGSAYGLSAHYAAASEAGLSEDDIRLARQARGSDGRSEELMRFVQTVALQRGDISDRDFGAVAKAGFGPDEIIEIIANIALNIFADYCNHVARTEVDFPVLRPGFEKPGADGQVAVSARIRPPTED